MKLFFRGSGQDDAARLHGQFPPGGMVRLAGRFGIHPAPKRGCWFNMVEMSLDDLVFQ
jgi:hypothetical protein